MEGAPQGLQHLKGLVQQQQPEEGHGHVAVAQGLQARPVAPHIPAQVSENGSENGHCKGLGVRLWGSMWQWPRACPHVLLLLTSLPPQCSHNRFKGT